MKVDFHLWISGVECGNNKFPVAAAAPKDWLGDPVRVDGCQGFFIPFHYPFMSNIFTISTTISIGGMILSTVAGVSLASFRFFAPQLIFNLFDAIPNEYALEWI